jgi:hypothetical protein
VTFSRVSGKVLRFRAHDRFAYEEQEGSGTCPTPVVPPPGDSSWQKAEKNCRFDWD